MKNMYVCKVEQTYATTYRHLQTQGYFESTLPIRLLNNNHQWKGHKFKNIPTICRTLMSECKYQTRSLGQSVKMT